LISKHLEILENLYDKNEHTLRGTSEVGYLLRPCKLGAWDPRCAAIAGFSPATHLWWPFQPRVGGSHVAEHSPVVNHGVRRIKKHY
ncbi:MAG: hypothetical protein ABJZ69_17420, partial [Hyphomicrobiales bacterium]